MSKKKQGQFQIFSSQSDSDKNEFQVFGKLREGQVQEGWYITIPLNASISITIRIAQVITPEVSGHAQNYTQLLIPTEAEMLDYFAVAKLEKAMCVVSADGEN